MLQENYKSKYGDFTFTITINYNKKTIETHFPNVTYNNTFEEKLRNIIFLDDQKDFGTYSYKDESGSSYTEVVMLNKNYSNKVAPNVILSNNDFGVETLMSLFYTYKLISVSYE